MVFNSEIHHRRSIRLKKYDYSQSGAYFVTVCTKNRKCLFGKILDGNMFLNAAGLMLQMVWDAIPEYYRGIKTDEFVIMPNHIHGIIIIVGAGLCACPDDGQTRHGAPTLSLPEIIHRLKTITTKEYIDGVKQRGWTRFPGKLWQRNYYEHIIRNGPGLDLAREYIINNPRKWDLDRENPDNICFRGRPPCLP